MCGIAGLVSSVPIQPEWLRGMADLARHRGPDDEGYVGFARGEATAFAGADTMPNAIGQSFLGSPKHVLGRDGGDLGSVALGFRRLSIVDLSALGHQPMSINGNTWISYNGEIYNHVELRAE